jgi:hypothetical protein
VRIGKAGQDRQENVKIFTPNARAKSGKLRIKRACKMKKLQKIIKNCKKFAKMRAF